MADPKTLETYLQIPMRGRLVSGAELALRTGKTTACIYRWERLGKFPQRIKLADRAVAWKGDEVADWFDALGA